MKCQVLFSKKNKKNIVNMSSTELAQRVVKAPIIFRTIRLDDSCESPARQTIHIKCQVLFSVKKRRELLSATVLHGTVRITFCVVI